MREGGSDVVPAAGRRKGLLASAAAWLVLTAAATWWSGSVIAVWVHLPSAFATRATAAFAVLAVVVLVTIRARHPFRKFGAANVITTTRAGFVALVVGLVFETATAQTALTASVLGLAAVALDALDGRLARRHGCASEFGARFDMEVDAALILALSVLAWRHDRAGSWVLLSGLYRYAFVALGWAFTWLARPLPPSRRRQTVCVLQILALLAGLPMAVPADVARFGLAAALVLLTWSFALDVHWLWRTRSGTLPSQSRVHVS